jgi:hypothetical protein
MILGVMLFFDGALLALGNVRSFLPHLPPAACILTNDASHFADPLPRRPLPHHRPAKDVLLLRAEEQTRRDGLFPRRNHPRFPQMADHRCIGRDVRLSQFVRVRCLLITITLALPCPRHLLNLIFFFCFFFQRFLPCYPHILPSITFHRPVPQSAVCSPCTLGFLTSRALTHACVRFSS